MLSGTDAIWIILLIRLDHTVSTEFVTCFQVFSECSSGSKVSVSRLLSFPCPGRGLYFNLFFLCMYMDLCNPS